MAPKSPATAPGRPARALAEPLAVLSATALLFLFSMTRAGIWDPYELNVADLARRASIHLFGAASLVLPGAENRIPTLADLGRGELPITSIALSFRLFGLSERSGRLPMALWGIAGLVVLWLWLRRMVGGRAGTYGVLVLATMPLYFVHARTMLGDIATMASLLFSFAGLSVAILDPEPRGRADAGYWLLGAAGLGTGFLCRGGLIGVAVPALGVGLTALLVLLNDPGARLGKGRTAAAGLLTLVGLGAAALAMRGYAAATPNSYSVWAGAGIINGQKYATFDTVVHYLGHTLFPWSALLPLAAGRLFAAPPGVTGAALQREQRLRMVLLVGGGLAYGAYAWLAPRAGHLPFGAVGLFAAMGAVVLLDFERGAHPSRALAVASCLLAALLFEDFSRMPEKGLSAFGVANASFPEGFRKAGEHILLGSTALFVGLLLLSFIDADEAEPPRAGDRALTRYTAWEQTGGILRELNAVWQGNLSFFAVMIEAMLVGVGGLLFVGERLRWKLAFRDSLSVNLKLALINAWWALPLALGAGLFVLLTVRRLFITLLSKAGVRRAWVALAAGASAGLVLSVGYYPALANQLSPKEIFEAYRGLRGPGEPLGLLGVAGRSAAYYTGAEVKPFADVGAAFSWLSEGPERRFLAVRQEDLPRMNSLYRERAVGGGRTITADHNLPVLDAHSGQIELVSDRLADGQKNENPLGRLVGTAAPRAEHPVDANLEDVLQALGWGLFDGQDREPVASVVPGKTYTLHFYYRVLGPLTTQWKGFIHIDGFGRRFNGDHDVFEGKYPMSLWQVGDIITDRYEFKLEPNFSPGSYTMYYGFFVGDKRLTVRSGRHHENRIDGGPLVVR